MLQEVSDSRSNPNDQIAHAADVIGKGARASVFKAICHGKKRIKTVQEIADTTGLRRMRVLQEGNTLVKNKIVEPVEKNLKGDTAYRKDPFYDAHKKKIMSLASDSSKLKNFPTKFNPRIPSKTITIRIPSQRVNARCITIDGIYSFCRVRKVRLTNCFKPMAEQKFKKGMQKILRERGSFADWGGERNDLFTTRLFLNKNRRVVAAFAFKGKGTRGKLTPRKMGKNGDQIQRLFKSPAQVFLIQYWGEIDEAVLEQMGEFAKAKSVSDANEIYYGIIDGGDTQRIIAAYGSAFR